MSVGSRYATTVPVAELAWHRAGETLRWTMLALVLAASLALLAVPVLTAFLLVDKNYNEGWNAYHAARAGAGAVLYDDDLRRIVNYPFLSFYLSAWLAPLAGGVLFAGRALSLLGLLGIGVFCLIVARRLGAGWRGAWCAAAASIGFASLAAPGWIVIDDPQALAEALMLAGLAAYVAGRDDPRHLAAAAGLLMLGGFTKQTLVAIPLAITIDLFVRSRRRGLQWVGLCLACFAVLLAATYLVAGGDFIGHLLSPRAISWNGLTYHPRKFLIMFKLPLAIGAFWLASLAPREWRLLLRSYLVLSFLSGALFGLGDGVSYNTMFDTAVALGLVAGLALDGVRADATRNLAVRLVVLAVPLLLAWPVLIRGAELARGIGGLGGALTQARTEQALFRADADFLAAQQGRAICESLLLCFAAGKELVLDPFNARQMMLAGRLDERTLIDEIAHRRYGAIELRDVIYNDAPGVISKLLHAPPRFTDPVLEAIARSYHVARVSPGRVIYLPNSA